MAKYQHRVKFIEALQFLKGMAVPPLVNRCVDGTYVIRDSGYSHEQVRHGDYVIYPDAPRDADGEPTYPYVMSQREFESRYELVAEAHEGAVR